MEPKSPSWKSKILHHENWRNLSCCHQHYPELPMPPRLQFVPKDPRLTTRLWIGTWKNSTGCQPKNHWQAKNPGFLIILTVQTLNLVMMITDMLVNFGTSCCPIQACQDQAIGVPSIVVESWRNPEIQTSNTKTFPRDVGSTCRTCSPPWWTPVGSKPCSSSPPVSTWLGWFLPWYTISFATNMETWPKN